MMQPTNVRSIGIRKQIIRHSSCVDTMAEQKRVLNTTQSALCAIVGAIGFSRSLLRRRGPWDEAARNPKEYQPYRPYLKEDEMIVDVVRTVATRGDQKEQAAVRKAVTEYFETRCRLALEWLGDDAENDVLTLTLMTDREECVARGALTRALVVRTPESFERAATEEAQVLSLAQQLKRCCAETAKKLRLSGKPTMSVAQ